MTKIPGRAPTGEGGQGAAEPLYDASVHRRPATVSAMVKAQIAQLVEHAIENRSVAGSIPALGTTNLSFRSVQV